MGSFPSKNVNRILSLLALLQGLNSVLRAG